MLTSLFKRSGIYFFGLILGKTLSVIVFILFARSLLPEKFGDFVLFVTLLQIVTFLADFGLNQWYQKQADQVDKNKLLSQIISARIVTLIVSLFLSLIFLFLTSSFSQFVSVLFLLCLIPEAFLSVVDGFYLEKQQPLRVALKTTSRMAILFLAYLYYQSLFNLDRALKWYFISSILTFMWYFPWNRIKGFIFSSFAEIVKTLRSSSSYAFLIFSSFLYARGDSLVIRYVLNSSALGIYGAAYRYLESLSLLPTALSHNLFPISARKEGIAFDQLKKILLVTFLSGLIISLLVYLFSPLLITGLLGNPYKEAIPVLKIFSFVLLLFFINAPLATVVQSSNYVNRFLPWGFLNTSLNIILNLMLVPMFGIIAAAWAMLLTEITGLLINIFFLIKIYKT